MFLLSCTLSYLLPWKDTHHFLYPVAALALQSLRYRIIFMGGWPFAFTYRDHFFFLHITLTYINYFYSDARVSDVWEGMTRLPLQRYITYGTYPCYQYNTHSVYFLVPSKKSGRFLLLRYPPKSSISDEKLITRVVFLFCPDVLIASLENLGTSERTACERTPECERQASRLRQ